MHVILLSIMILFSGDKYKNNISLFSLHSVRVFNDEVDRLKNKIIIHFSDFFCYFKLTFFSLLWYNQAP